MAVRYETTHEVAYYECDINQQITFPALIGVAVKASEEQSDHLGRGSDYVHQLGLGWVITNYQLFIERMPKVGEVITVATMAMEYNKYFCYRNFWIYDAAGEELVRIESVFVLMDLVNRKMASVPEAVIAPYESEKVNRIKRYPKVEKIVAGERLNYRVRFYDIDSNQHVNNSVYFNWMIDVLGYDFLTSHQPTYVNIRFDKEVEYGNLVESHYEVVAKEDMIESRHEIRMGTELYCEANFSWQPRKA